MLSGGERRRVALAKLLLEGHDMLLLDEPTNHLDAQSVAWLQTYLQELHLLCFDFTLTSFDFTLTSL